MKFSRYFQDTQTSEWKKAYIDYHRLKVKLRVIQAMAPRQVDTWSSFGGTEIDRIFQLSPDNEETYDESEEHFNQGATASAHIAGVWASGTDPTTNGIMDSSGHGPASSIRQRASHLEISSPSLTSASPPLRVSGRDSNASYPQALLLPRTRRHSSLVPPLFRGSGSPTPVTLHTVLSNLPAIHAEFFGMLDAELDKVETFYIERAKEMHERAKMLRKQLDELGIHREMFYESDAPSKAQSWAKKAYLSISRALSSLIQWTRDTGRGDMQAPERRRPNVNHPGSWRNGVASGAAKTNRSTTSSATLNDSARLLSERWNSFRSLSPGGRQHPLDPYEYRCAKRRLRHAVVEHYRGLEILRNYRFLTFESVQISSVGFANDLELSSVLFLDHAYDILAFCIKILNLTGFRKALRKYGKITKISVTDAYIKEKVEPSAFGSGAMVSTMLKEMEHLFAARFEHGNKKKAMSRLRVGSSVKTYHSSTFRSGWWLGLAVPAIFAGSYLSLQEYTRQTLPSWNILLFIYSIFAVPIFLALLIGLNVFVWAHEKISYVFIFRLNLRSKRDHHEYFELPAFLLCTLAYAFWFSLAQIGSPMLWPLIWLVLTLAIMFNPFRRFMWGSACWWTIKQIAKLGASGWWVVEFTDVWLGDQLCSLVYTLSNLYFVGCFYAQFSLNFPGSTVQSSINPESAIDASFPVKVTFPYQAESSAAHNAFQSLLSSAYAPQAQEAWSTCGIARNWGWYCFLGTLPFVVRVVHNVRRYWDSKLPSQLFNAGKYVVGMIYYLCYCYWRHQMSPRSGKSYILYCFMATVNAIYSCVWDITMDWGMCKPHARYPLLRPELVYKSHLPYYYFAMVSNLCIRFIWLTFVFVNEENYELYSFIVAMLEMLRRVQWNFYRLENKHLHNTGLHRIMHEAPLPYNLEELSEEARMRKRMARLS